MLTKEQGFSGKVQRVADAASSSLMTVKPETFSEFHHCCVVILRVIKNCIPNFVGNAKAEQHLYQSGPINKVTMGMTSYSDLPRTL